MISPDSSETEAMNYGMLGDDNSTTEEKLEKYSGTVSWSFLAPHYTSGSLYFVDPALALHTVGSAFVADDTKLVREWLKSGDLVKIEELHAKHWEDSDPEFEALVVSPFVFCRPCG